MKASGGRAGERSCIYHPLIGLCVVQQTLLLGIWVSASTISVSVNDRSLSVESKERVVESFINQGHLNPFNSPQCLIRHPYPKFAFNHVRAGKFRIPSVRPEVMKLVKHQPLDRKTRHHTISRPRSRRI